MKLEYTFLEIYRTAVGEREKSRAVVLSVKVMQQTDTEISLSLILGLVLARYVENWPCLKVSLKSVN